MNIDNSLANGQAHSGSSFFHGKKGLKYFLNIPLSNSHACIANRNHRTLFSYLILELGFHSYFPLLINGIQAVV